jgi:hypothetical protein
LAVAQTSAKVFKLDNNLFNNSTVLSPNNRGSSASLDPNLIEGAFITKLALVSKLNPFIALNPIVNFELNKIWSSLLLNTNRPELIMICFFEYLSGCVGIYDE